MARFAVWVLSQGNLVPVEQWGIPQLGDRHRFQVEGDVLYSEDREVAELLHSRGPGQVATALSAGTFAMFVDWVEGKAAPELQAPHLPPRSLLLSEPALLALQSNEGFVPAFRDSTGRLWQTPRKPGSKLGRSWAARRIRKSAKATVHVSEANRRVKLALFEGLVAVALVFVYNAVENKVQDSPAGDDLNETAYRIFAPRVKTQSSDEVVLVNLEGQFDKDGRTDLEEVGKLLSKWTDSDSLRPSIVGIDVQTGAFDGPDLSTGSREAINWVTSVATLDGFAASLTTKGTPTFLAAKSILPTLAAGESYPKKARLTHAVVVPEKSVYEMLADEMRVGDEKVYGLSHRMREAYGKLRNEQAPPGWTTRLTTPYRDEVRGEDQGKVVLGPKFFINRNVAAELEKGMLTITSVDDPKLTKLNGKIVILGNAVEEDKKIAPYHFGMVMQGAALRTKMDSPILLFRSKTAEDISTGLALFGVAVAVWLRLRAATAIKPQSKWVMFSLFAGQFALATGLAFLFASWSILWLQYAGLSAVAIGQFLLEEAIGLGDRIEKIAMSWENRRISS